MTKLFFCLEYALTHNKGRKMKKQFLIMLVVLGALLATNTMAKTPTGKSITLLNHLETPDLQTTGQIPIYSVKNDADFDAVYNAGTLTITGGSACSVTVEDANGVEMISLLNYDGTLASISTNGWPSGTYYVYLKCDPRHGKYFIIYENNTMTIVPVLDEDENFVLRM